MKKSTNPISSFWLSKRQAKALRMITGGRLLDIGSRSERIRPDAISLDIDREVRPDVCASAEYLPFKSDSFDYISMLEVVEHLEEDQLERALEESKRVGNYLVLSTPNCDSRVWNRIVWPLWSHTVGREWIGAHKQFFRKRTLAELLERVFGMKILEMNYSRWNLLLLAQTNPLPLSSAHEWTMELSPEIG
ncbi:MAG TPA: methyltransferase domain-containing protein [Nitrososphaerales archaeon]|nr:methyltransferase domain-containing protein [Nitrososphaerales archaeon]